MTHEHFLEPDEKIVYSIRRHSFAFVSSILILVIMAVTPLLILLFVGAASIRLSPASLEWVVMGMGTYYLFWIILGVVLWMDYYYDLYIVTDTHILDIDQTSLLSRRISHISLARVQDVTTKVKGFWQNQLDFGPILVQTAGHDQDISLEDVPHPHEVAAKIMRLHDDLIAREQRQQEIGEGEGVHPPAK